MTDNKTTVSNTLVNEIAKRLQEKESKPIGQIRKIFEICGEEFANLMVDNAVLLYQNEGILTQQGDRKRTLGGVFFYLVRGSIPTDLSEEIFPQKSKRNAQERLTWGKQHKYVQKALKQKLGEVKDVNITVSGVPQHIEFLKDKDLVMVALTDRVESYQSFPHGVIQPPTEPVKFFVYIGMKQWKKKAGTLFTKDPEAVLTVEGAFYPDLENGVVAVFGRNIQTESGKKAQARQEKVRENQERHAENEKKMKEAKQKRIEKRPETKVSSDIPEPYASKLRPLYGARNLFKKRLADIEAMPPEKQAGLQTTKMMLERTEKQIAELEAKAKAAQEKDE